MIFFVKKAKVFSSSFTVPGKERYIGKHFTWEAVGMTLIVDKYISFKGKSKPSRCLTTVAQNSRIYYKILSEKTLGLEPTVFSSGSRF